MFSVVPTTRNSSTTHRSRRTTWEKWTVTWFWSCAVACLTVVVVRNRRILNSLLKHVGAWVRGSLGPVTLHTNVLMNQSEVKWICAVGAKRGKKCVIACKPCKRQLVSVLHLTPFFFTSSHPVAAQQFSRSVLQSIDITRRNLMLITLRA